MQEAAKKRLKRVKLVELVGGGSTPSSFNNPTPYGEHNDKVDIASPFPRE